MAYEELKNELNRNNLPVTVRTVENKLWVFFNEIPNYTVPLLIIEKDDDNYAYTAQNTEGTTLYTRSKVPLRMLIDDIKLALQNKTPTSQPMKFFSEETLSSETETTEVKTMQFELKTITKNVIQKRDKDNHLETTTKWKASFRELNDEKKEYQLLTASIGFDKEPTHLTVGNLYSINIKE